MSRGTWRLGTSSLGSFTSRPGVAVQALAGVAGVKAGDGVGGARVAPLVSGRALVRIRRAG